jgi:hypothetical protein
MPSTSSATDEHVSPRQHLLQRPGVPVDVGVLGDPGQRRVHALATGVDDALDVADGHVDGAGVQQHLQHGGAGGTGAGQHDARLADVLGDDPQRVAQRGQHHDGRAVLVVVEDRDVEPLAQTCLDLEAARRRDVLEVDAGEAGRDGRDGLDDLVDVLRVQDDGPRVDVGEVLEQGGLALHDR